VKNAEEQSLTNIPAAVIAAGRLEEKTPNANSKAVPKKDATNSSRMSALGGRAKNTAETERKNENPLHHNLNGCYLSYNN
jgi:hypothetical protein